MGLHTLFNTGKRRIAVAALGLAVITGTYGGNEGGFPPLVVRKTGTSVGINLAFSTQYEPGAKFYGIDLSVFSNSRVLDSSERATLNGLEISLANMPHELSERSQNYNQPLHVNGLQIGLFNFARAGNVVQLGIYNDIPLDEDQHMRGFLLNYKFAGRTE